MTKHEAKKRALVAEAEVHRHMLALELRNLQLYGERARRKFDLIKALQPLLSLGPFVQRDEFGRRRFKWLRLVRSALLGFQVYRKVAPLFRGEVASRKSIRREVGERSQLSPEV